MGHLSDCEGERAEDGEDGLVHCAGQEGQLGELAKVGRVQLVLRRHIPRSHPICGEHHILVWPALFVQHRQSCAA